MKNRNQINLDYLFRDQNYSNQENRPYSICRIIDGRYGHLFSTFLMAGGEGLHPTVVCCHGYPGNEENMDTAHALRRVGFNVMVFHYSGSWGSGGTFSLQHCIDDAGTVIDYMLSEPDYRVDEKNLFLFGQSMGGFVVSHTLSIRKDIKAAVLAAPADFPEMWKLAQTSPKEKEAFMAGLAEGDGWLVGSDIEKVYQESRDFADGRTFSDLAPKQDVPMLIIGAKYDTIVPTQKTIVPWTQKLQKEYGDKIQYKCLETDHMFADMRCTLTELTAEYFTDQLGSVRGTVLVAE